LLKHIIPASGMVMDTSLRARAERGVTSEGEPVAFIAPHPVVLARSTGVVLREKVTAALDVDVSASSSASSIAVEAEHHAFLAPVPLVLAASWIRIAIKRERIVATFAVVMSTTCHASSRASSPVESLALIAKFPIALPWGTAVVQRHSIVPACGSVVRAAGWAWSNF